MGRIILCKIDVTKIDKEKLFKGQKGTYLDCVLMENDETDQYGNDFVIKEGQSKEDRAAGKKSTILGNAKYVKRKTEEKPAEKPPVADAPTKEEQDDVPF